MQARALAASGCEVLQIDLCGCGDSSGDFGDASWQDWLDDVVAAHAWLRAHSDAPLTLWGLRAGCLLAADAAPLLPSRSISSSGSPCSRASNTGSKCCD